MVQEKEFIIAKLVNYKNKYDNSFINILSLLYETFGNFVSSVLRLYCKYIARVYFTEITKIFKQLWSIISTIYNIHVILIC